MMKSNFVLALPILIGLITSPCSSAGWLDDFKSAADAVNEIKKTAENILDSSSVSRDTSSSPQTKSADLFDRSKNEDNQPENVNSNQATILSLPQYYFEREKYFSLTNRGVGEYQVYDSPYPNSFNKLYVRTHKKIPLFGLLPYIEVASDVEKALQNRITADSQIYQNLGLVNLVSSHLASENLKVDKSGKADNRNKRISDVYVYKKSRKLGGRTFHSSYVPRFHVQSLASGMLTPKAFSKYFCLPQQNCQHSGRFERGGMQWGGAQANAFKARKSYHAFIENEVPNLKTWASQFENKEYYIVGKAVFYEYDFKRKGFELSLMLPNDKRYIYVPMDSSYGLITLGDSKGAMNKVFFPLPEDEAETFVENIESRVLYFIVKGKIHDFFKPSTGTHPKFSPVFSGVKLAYDITGSKIEFYTDSFLKRKVFEKEIN